MHGIWRKHATYLRIKPEQEDDMAGLCFFSSVCTLGARLQRAATDQLVARLLATVCVRVQPALLLGLRGAPVNVVRRRDRLSAWRGSAPFTQPPLQDC